MDQWIDDSPEEQWVDDKPIVDEIKTTEDVLPYLSQKITEGLNLAEEKLPGSLPSAVKTTRKAVNLGLEGIEKVLPYLSSRKYLEQVPALKEKHSTGIYERNEAMPEIGKLDESMMKFYGLPKELSASDVVSPILDAALPVVVPKGVQALDNARKNLISKGKVGLDKGLGVGLDYTPVSNLSEIQKAEKALGFEMPRGMKTSNETFQKLESGVSQSGSLAARSTRKKYDDFFENLRKAEEKLENLKSSDSPFKIGQGIREELSSQIKSQTAPTSEAYEALRPHMQQIEVSKDVVNKSFGNLKKSPIFQTVDGKAMLEDIKSAALEMPELNSLKEFRSSIGQSLGPNASMLDKKRIDEIYGTLTQVRDESINAYKAGLPKAMHKEVDKFVSDIALADSMHSGNIQDISGIKSIVGNKPVKSPGNFLEQLSEGIDETKLAERAAGLDVGSLQKLQKVYPSVFEKAKQARINDMIQRSMDSKGFNPTRFIKQVSAMGAEEKSLIFTPNQLAEFENLQTIKQSIPQKVGPSGTPEGISIKKALSPTENVQDFLAKRALDYAEAPYSSNAVKTPWDFQMTPQVQGIMGVGAISNQKQLTDQEKAKKYLEEKQKQQFIEGN